MQLLTNLDIFRTMCDPKGQRSGPNYKVVLAILLAQQEAVNNTFLKFYWGNGNVLPLTT